VSDLEKALEISLVIRKGRGLELTTIGKAMARRYNLAEVELNAGMDEINTLTKNGAGRISVGAMPLSRARILPDSIVQFIEEYPNADISVAEGSHIELIEPLRDGELDFLIGALRDPAPGRDLVQIPLFDDCPVVLGRAGHPLTQCESPDLAQLSEYDWCIPQKGVPLRDRWEAMYVKDNLPIPRVAVECGSGLAIRQILMRTDFLTLLSPDQVAVELEAGWLSIIAHIPDTLTRTIGLTYREDWHPTQLQKTFLEVLKTSCRTNT
jgi:DNA-binding transcriptional LysR family regulator